MILLDHHHRPNHLVNELFNRVSSNLVVYTKLTEQISAYANEQLANRVEENNTLTELQTSGFCFFKCNERIHEFLFTGMGTVMKCTYQLGCLYTMRIDNYIPHTSRSIIIKIETIRSFCF